MNSYKGDVASHGQDRWLKPYYFVRAAFSVVWVVAALTVGRHSSSIAAVLLVGYPVWDAAANYVDASRNGGLAANPTQAFNVAVSLIVSLAVVLALAMDMNRVLYVFGAWAIFSGLLQLATAIRRWKTSGGQWAMILSGGQSAVAGAFFIAQAQTPAPFAIADIAGYTGFGAFYFLVSAIWLTVIQSRAKAA
ncbi:DUF308 domain-containing protein [Shinella zoogloeoides]|uniref:DUF308 domain-containing protein n=1 Tax=Shinella zoogloeoides TaxID=352475 RepID=UPI0028A8BA92|nr:DUF308 domain-containing protein [Shinella zoogloeoides]